MDTVEQSKKSELILPMLAKTLNIAKPLIFPCYLQERIKGTRMLMTRDKAYAKTGKPYLTNVVAHLRCNLPEAIYLDGMLTLPDKYSSQDTMKAIKEFDPILSPQLEFIVYDCYFADSPRINFVDRYSLLKQLLAVPVFPQNIKLLPILEVNSIDELQNAHFNCTVPSGDKVTYKGMMVKLNSPYTP
jgi:hypothetical protein